MPISFTLTMPNNNAWNGHWTGEDKVFCRIIDTENVPKEVIGESFYYDFGDGWGALVSVEKVKPKIANKMLKKSEGFMGYDWMIDEIIRYGRILTRKERNEGIKPEPLKKSSVFVPFAFEMYGRIEIENAKNREDAIAKAEKKLSKMSVAKMLDIAEYLPDSDEIDTEGCILDENGECIFEE